MLRRALYLAVVLLAVRQLAVSAVRNALVNRLFRDYDKTLPPHFGKDHPTVVHVQLYIVSFDSVQAATLDYKISAYLRVWWKDRRLQFNETISKTHLTFTHHVVRLFWIPDIFFANEKQGHFHNVLQHNQAIHLHENGLVFLTTRVSLRLSCDMDLRDFPMDVQKCGLVIMSYAYSTENIILKWPEKASVKRPGLEIPQFALVGMHAKQETQVYSIGNYSILSLSFVLKRELGYYFSQVYLPSILTVALSWVSFWICHDSVPARISLGLLTVLTMTTIFTSVYSALPKVSYLKAIDLWTSVCLLLVFAALLEFAAVNVLSRSGGSTARLGKKNRRRSSVGDTTQTPLSSNNGDTVLHQKRNRRWKMNLKRKLHLDRKEGESVGAARLDKISRYMFPIAFAIFKISYWVYYLQRYFGNIDVYTQQ